MPVRPLPKPLSTRRVLGFAAQALLPVVGLTLRRHLDNLDVLGAEFAPLPPFASDARLFVLAPHPDDETLGAGGLIARARAAGIPVQIGFLSNGDGSRTTQFSQILRGKAEKTLPAIARLRQAEALAAAAVLGVEAQNVLFFGFPDGGAASIWNGRFSAHQPFQSPFTGFNCVPDERAWAPGTPYYRAAMVENLASALRKFAPTHVFTTHPLDSHPDHATAYFLCEAAIARLDMARRPTLLAFLIHLGIWPVPNGFHPDLPLCPPQILRRGGTLWQSTALSTAEIAAKKAALECHRTQMGSTPRYLRAFVRRTEIFGSIAKGRDSL